MIYKPQKTTSDLRYVVFNINTGQYIKKIESVNIDDTILYTSNIIDAWAFIDIKNAQRMQTLCQKLIPDNIFKIYKVIITCERVGF